MALSAGLTMVKLSLLPDLSLEILGCRIKSLTYLIKLFFFLSPIFLFFSLEEQVQITQCSIIINGRFFFKFLWGIL